MDTNDWCIIVIIRVPIHVVLCMIHSDCKNHVNFPGQKHAFMHVFFSLKIENHDFFSFTLRVYISDSFVLNSTEI